MIIGFDIGGTKCAVCVGEEDNGKIKIKEKRIIPTDLSISPYEMTDKLIAVAKNITEKIDAIGISCGGPLNSEKGLILSPPNLIGWDDVKIVDYIAEKCNTEVYLENDANACALVEWKYGAGQGCNNMIFLTFGTGLGAGMILNGKLYRGACDMAGEVGHIRLSPFGPVGYGKTGSFEGFCSGNGIAQLGKLYALESFQKGEKVSYCSDISQIEKINAKTISEYAKKGEKDAAMVYHKCGEMLGVGLSVLIDILNPERIVIGSVFQRSGELLRSSMQKILVRECIGASLEKCVVVPAALGDNIGDYAAVTVAQLHRKGEI